MHRESQLAKALATALSRRGLTVGPRRLERWTADGLGPLPDATFGDQVDHYSVLADLARSGRYADPVALRLASRGRACPRLRKALLRRMGFEPTSQPPAIPAVDVSGDLSSEAAADPLFEYVEDLARLARTPAADSPPLMTKTIALFEQNAARHASRLNETPDQILHSCFVNIAWQMAGGDVYNVEAMAAVANLDPAELGEPLGGFMESVRIDPAAREEMYRTMPLQRIADIASWMLRYAPIVLHTAGVAQFSDDDIAELCTMFAPWAAYFFGMIAPRLTELGLDPGAVPDVVWDLAGVPRDVAGPAVNLTGRKLAPAGSDDKPIHQA
jgi:hypothetical protein